MHTEYTEIPATCGWLFQNKQMFCIVIMSEQISLTLKQKGSPQSQVNCWTFIQNLCQQS